MNETEFKASISDVVYLCSCAVNNTAPEQSRLETIDYGLLFDVSSKHQLSSIVGQTLQSVDASDPSFDKAVAAAQRNDILFDNELKIVISKLESEGIWYMPLKGTVLKDLYPRFAMREMCDVDLLFDSSRADDVKRIMESLDFKTVSFGDINDDDYRKPPVLNFEMHRMLFCNRHDRRLYDYYLDVKKKLIKDTDSNYGFHFSPEDFYIFMIAHEFKHYSTGGTGLRSLLDTYVYLNSNQLDMDYVETEISKLRISVFEKQNRVLAIKVFKGESLIDEEQKMFDYIASSGAYGILSHKVVNEIERAGKGKLHYIFYRVFGPISKDDPKREHFRKRYYKFYKYPVLLPFLPIYRLIKSIKRNPKKVSSEVKVLKDYKSSDK